MAEAGREEAEAGVGADSAAPPPRALFSCGGAHTSEKKHTETQKKRIPPVAVLIKLPEGPRRS